MIPCAAAAGPGTAIARGHKKEAGALLDGAGADGLGAGAPPPQSKLEYEDLGGCGAGGLDVGCSDNTRRKDWAVAVVDDRAAPVPIALV